MMYNEELKKKIVEVLKKAMEPIEYGGDSEHAPEVHYPTEEEIADAIIAAVIGYVKDLQAQVDSLEITNIALQAGYDDAEKDRLYWVDKYKEAEHRAETLERAFRDFLAEYLTAVNEANSYDCGIPEMFGWYANVLPYEDKVTNMLNEYLQQAEKELAEERK